MLKIGEVYEIILPSAETNWGLIYWIGKKQC